MPMTAPGARQPAIRRLWPWAVLVTAAVLMWRLFQSPDGQAKSPAALPVAGVVAATTQRRDVHVEIKGIGLVQAYNTVTVKPRINGQITQIVFTEGKAVHAGDILARIDSRFLLTQLHQAQANSAKDEAQLENAKRELTRLTDALVKAFVSRQLVDGQQSQVAVLEATVRADAAAIENARIQLALVPTVLLAPGIGHFHRPGNTQTHCGLPPEQSADHGRRDEPAPAGARHGERGPSIRVVDSGPGIAAGEFPKVLGRFYRADPSRKTVGTGLGLSLVASIARLHGFGLALCDQPAGCCIELKCWAETAVKRL
jgi:hypothetical protein